MIVPPQLQRGEIGRACEGSAPPSGLARLARWLPLVLMVGLLWWRLIDHLRIEWALNPQYAYGWAVPFLTAFLIWDRWRITPCGVGQAEHTSALQGTRHAGAALGISLALGMTYFVTRLVQEANPEWRLVSWALVTLVVAITFLAGSIFLQGPGTLRRRIMLPVTFVFVAVPWPTPIEAPLIQALTRANASMSIELLQLIGVPAIQHGNVIEVGAGMLGIDEACSGIRSFQAAVMLAVFFAFFRRMTFKNGLMLCAAGFAFSFAFNVFRTTLLTWIASRLGVAAIAKWHDPAGGVILVACLLALWLMANRMRSGSIEQEVEYLRAQRALAIPPPSRSVFLVSVWGLCLLLFVEGLVEGWYRWHERQLGRAVRWTVIVPRGNPGFRERPFAEKTRRHLRFDQGLSAEWQEVDGARWQGIFLRWDPGRVASFLARSHTPEVCLTAAGQEVVWQSELRFLRVKGLKLPFRCYGVKTDFGLLRVYYFLWEDKGGDSELDLGSASLTYQNRLRAVLAGRRNPGQRSLELAVLGIPDAGQADQAMTQQLEKLVVLE